MTADMPDTAAPASAAPFAPDAAHIVGIDLGTSHTVVAHVPVGGTAADIALLPVAQRVSASEVAAQVLLPSARYQAAPRRTGAMPWQQPWTALGADAQA
ncbi:molecular chaperone DnaK, partial [Delftia sp. BR1]